MSKAAEHTTEIRPVPNPWLAVDFLLLAMVTIGVLKVALPSPLGEISVEDVFTTTTLSLLVVGWAAVYGWHRLQGPHNFVRPWGEARKNRGQKPSEFPPPFPNGWFMLCESRELAKGQVKKFDVLGQALVLFRDYQGKVAVLEAWCPHLGAHLGLGGTVSKKSNCLRCPFHGWEFDSNGTCQFVEGATVIPPDSNIRSFPCDEVNNVIFFWHDAERRDPTWRVRPFAPVHGGATGKWYQCGRTFTQVNAHIQEIPENGADVAHLNVLHGRFVWDKLSPTLNHHWSAEWAPHPLHKHVTEVSIVQNIQIGGFTIPKSRFHTKIEQHGPGIVELQIFTMFGTLIMWEFVTPLLPTTQRVSHVCYASPWVPRLFGYAIIWAVEEQFQRDIVIWENKKYQTRPKISKADGPILGFRRWFKQFYSDNSISFSDAVAKENMLDW